MYTKTIPHKNFRDKPRNQEVSFNLTEHEVMKLLVEFQAIFDWQDKLKKQGDDRPTDTEEVIEFYNNFEEVLLTAWGELSENGDHFRKGGRYDFAESSLFHATMKYFLQNPSEVNELLDGLMPKDMQDLIKAADANLATLAKKDGLEPSEKAELDRLRAELAAAQK